MSVLLADVEHDSLYWVEPRTDHHRTPPLVPVLVRADKSSSVDCVNPWFYLFPSKDPYRFGELVIPATKTSIYLSKEEALSAWRQRRIAWAEERIGWIRDKLNQDLAKGF